MDSKSKKLHKKMQKFFQTNFPRYNQILRYTALLPVLYPCNVRVEKIGMSLEGRPIRMVVLQADPTHPKPGVMIEAGIHAREWLSHSTILYVIDRLLTTQTMLNYMDFYVIPCVNPDGYEYTHTSCRLWRKNLNHNNSKDVKKWGVDLNRNFPVAFGCEGSSKHRESALYHGAKALSEPETQSLANALAKYSCRLQLYISLHCFGHLIMYPWSHTTDSICDERDLLNCAMAAKKAMKCNTPKSKFTVGQLSKAMYIASGTTTDYVRRVHKVKFAYTIELHKRGRSGFEPQRSDIIKVGQETFAGIEAMVKFVHKFYTQHTCKRKRSASCNDLARRCRYF